MLERDGKPVKKDIFPYFFFEDDEELCNVIRTLHLNLEQQELFGLLYIYCKDFLEKYTEDDISFDEIIDKIPYEYIAKVGSIKFLNLFDDLKRVLEYVRPDFLIKVLRLYPDEEFDVLGLNKELLFEYLEEGHCVPSSFDGTIEHSFIFHTVIKKAYEILSILKKGDVYLCDDKDARLSKEVPREIIDLILKERAVFYEGYPERDRLEKINKPVDLYDILSGINDVTFLKLDKSYTPARWYITINETGEKFLEWFNGLE